MNTTDTAPYEDEIEFGRYVHFLIRNWLIILGCGVAGALVAMGFVLTRPSQFRSTATLAIVQSGGTSPSPTPAALKTLLVTPAVAGETVDELGLNRDGITPQRFIDDYVDVQPVAGTNVVKLGVALSDPARARDAAELLANKTITDRRRIDQERASITRASLEKPVAEADRELRAAEERLSTFQATAGLDLLEAQSKSDDRRRAQVSDVEIRLESERARLATLEQELARQPSDPISPPEPPIDGVRTISARAMLQYDIVQSRATIARLTREQRETLAKTSDRDLEKKRTELYQRRLQLARLQSEYNARSKTYNSLLARYEAASSSATDVPLQLVSKPVLPDQPIRKSRRQPMAIGAVLGLLCGLFVAWAIEGRRDRRAVVERT